MTSKSSAMTNETMRIRVAPKRVARRAPGARQRRARSGGACEAVGPVLVANTATHPSKPMRSPVLSASK
jgi:hypothetical protein